MSDVVNSIEEMQVVSPVVVDLLASEVLNVSQSLESEDGNHLELSSDDDEDDEDAQEAVVTEAVQDLESDEKKEESSRADGSVNLTSNPFSFNPSRAALSKAQRIAFQKPKPFVAKGHVDKRAPQTGIVENMPAPVEVEEFEFNNPLVEFKAEAKRLEANKQAELEIKAKLARCVLKPSKLNVDKSLPGKSPIALNDSGEVVPRFNNKKLALAKGRRTRQSIDAKSVLSESIKKANSQTIDDEVKEDESEFSSEDSSDQPILGPRVVPIVPIVDQVTSEVVVQDIIQEYQASQNATIPEESDDEDQSSARRRRKLRRKSLKTPTRRLPSPVRDDDEEPPLPVDEEEFVVSQMLDFNNKDERTKINSPIRNYSDEVHFTIEDMNDIIQEDEETEIIASPIVHLSVLNITAPESSNLSIKHQMIIEPKERPNKADKFVWQFMRDVDYIATAEEVGESYKQYYNLKKIPRAVAASWKLWRECRALPLEITEEERDLVQQHENRLQYEQDLRDEAYRRRQEQAAIDDEERKEQVLAEYIAQVEEDGEIEPRTNIPTPIPYTPRPISMNDEDKKMEAEMLADVDQVAINTPTAAVLVTQTLKVEEVIAPVEIVEPKSVKPIVKVQINRRGKKGMKWEKKKLIPEGVKFSSPPRGDVQEYFDNKKSKRSKSKKATKAKKAKKGRVTVAMKAHTFVIQYMLDNEDALMTEVRKAYAAQFGIKNAPTAVSNEWRAWRTERGLPIKVSKKQKRSRAIRNKVRKALDECVDDSIPSLDTIDLGEIRQRDPTPVKIASPVIPEPIVENKDEDDSDNDSDDEPIMPMPKPVASNNDENVDQHEAPKPIEEEEDEDEDQPILPAVVEEPKAKKVKKEREPSPHRERLSKKEARKQRHTFYSGLLNPKREDGSTSIRRLIKNAMIKAGETTYEVDHLVKYNMRLVRKRNIKTIEEYKAWRLDRLEKQMDFVLDGAKEDKPSKDFVNFVDERWILGGTKWDAKYMIKLIKEHSDMINEDYVWYKSMVDNVFTILRPWFDKNRFIIADHEQAIQRMTKEQAAKFKAKKKIFKAKQAAIAKEEKAKAKAATKALKAKTFKPKPKKKNKAKQAKKTSPKQVVLLNEDGDLLEPIAYQGAPKFVRKGKMEIDDSDQTEYAQKPTTPINNNNNNNNNMQFKPSYDIQAPLPPQIDQDFDEMFGGVSFDFDDY